MARLTWEDGVVKVDGQELPGILIDHSVDCRVRFDEQDVDGASGKKKTPLGWEDADVNLSLGLTTDEDENGQDCYDKLEIINKLFRGHDDKANPKVLKVDSRHLLARGVGELIFSGLSSVETDQEDVIIVNLQFVENNPPVVKTEKAVAKSAHQKAAKEKAAADAQKRVKVPEVNPAEPDVMIDLN